MSAPKFLISYVINYDNGRQIIDAMTMDMDSAKAFSLTPTQEWIGKYQNTVRDRLNRRPEGVPESAPLVCNVQVLAITKLEG